MGAVMYQDGEYIGCTDIEPEAHRHLVALIQLGYDITLQNGQVLFSNGKTGEDCLIHTDEYWTPLKGEGLG